MCKFTDTDNLNYQRKSPKEIYQIREIATTKLTKMLSHIIPSNDLWPIYGNYIFSNEVYTLVVSINELIQNRIKHTPKPSNAQIKNQISYGSYQTCLPISEHDLLIHIQSEILLKFK